MHACSHRVVRLTTILLFCFAAWVQPGKNLCATDYFLTIGGGYSPEGNQASLEANVVFFQQLLDDKHRGPRHQATYFADGNDAAADLQVLVNSSGQQGRPATDFIASLHRRRGEQLVTYRNHRVPKISGSLDPTLIRGSIESIAKLARRGDRLIIYVTAHGSEGTEDSPYNTTIDCWNEGKIRAREFSKWLNDVPADVPILMIMAQCYCGGFARTIFEEMDESKGLTQQVRAGFFAQQFNLPAAGCRPDIQNDEEFSSYFWGAIAGHTRKGTPVKDCDLDADGAVSFAEAYAYAVSVGETIDIPLRTSDVMLRVYSRLPDAGGQRNSGIGKPVAPADDPTASPFADDARPQPSLSSVTGSLRKLADRGRPVSRRIIIELSRVLGFSLDDDVTDVFAAYDKHRSTSVQSSGSGRGTRRGGGSGRRDLLREIREKWPELGDERHWEESSLLASDNQKKLLEEIKQLPSWKAYEERRRQIDETDQQAERHELREVKFRRLIKAVELVVLEANLPVVANPKIVERYRQMVALEESVLNPASSR